MLLMLLMLVLFKVGEAGTIGEVGDATGVGDVGGVGNVRDVGDGGARGNVRRVGGQISVIEIGTSTGEIGRAHPRERFWRSAPSRRGGFDVLCVGKKRRVGHRDG